MTYEEFIKKYDKKVYELGQELILREMKSRKTYSIGEKEQYIKLVKSAGELVIGDFSVCYISGAEMSEKRFNEEWDSWVKDTIISNVNKYMNRQA